MTMKKIIHILLLCTPFLFSCGHRSETASGDSTKKNDSPFVNKQTINPYVDVDVSPMDMSYFPADYPKLKMADSINTPPVMRVIYSRPHKGGRKIFGGLQKFGEPWRLGANEATEIEFFKPVTIQSKKINPGRYVLYCIPYEDKWTIILNNSIYTWGLKIDSTKDLVHFDIPIQKSAVDFEYLTMLFKKTNTGAELIMAWDDTEARLPINF
jgi:hypothetical protein